jgi:hypothetical protein
MSASQTAKRRMSVGKDVEGSGRDQICANIPAFVVRDCGKPRTTLLRMVDIGAEIRKKTNPE